MCPFFLITKCEVQRSLYDGYSLSEQFIETLPCFLHLRTHLTRDNYSWSGIMALLCLQVWVMETCEFLKHGGCAACHLSGNVHTAHRPYVLLHPKCWVDVTQGLVSCLVCFLPFTVTESFGSNMKVCKHGDEHQYLRITRISFLCLTSFVNVALNILRSLWWILSW